MTPRMLIVRLGSLGDIVHALPAVASLRAAFPQACLDWLVEARWQELIELNPDISNVIPADTLAWRRAVVRAESWRSFAALVHTLRRARYDIALDLQGLYKSALLARLSGAREQLGFEKGFVKERGAARFYTRAVRPPENTHVIEMNLALARAAGADRRCLRFPLPTQAEDEAYVDRQLHAHKVRDFFFLSPGGGWGAKRWPVERYALLHNTLARERGWRSVLNAGPGEEELVSQFLAHARVTRPVHFPLSLRQLVALVRRARVVISGDTGPLHLAAALGTPAVGLYGPTDPVRNGPYGERTVVLHHPEQAVITYRRDNKVSPALLAITVEDVVSAVRRCLEAAGG